MSTSSVSGSGTVIDVSGIVNSLMQVEQRPLGLINTKIGAANVSISAMSELKAAVDAAYSAASAIEDPIMLSAKTATVSDASVARVTVTDSAAANVGAINVAAVKLAEAQRTSLALPNAVSADAVLAPIGSGTLEISIGVESTLLSEDERSIGHSPGAIDITNKTLEEIRDQINEDFAGMIRADLVNTGYGDEPWRLVLTGAQTGASATFSVSYEAATVAPFQAAQSAEATVGGILVKSETNVFEEAIPGVKIELLKAQTMNGVTGSSAVNTTLTVGDNKAEVTTKINAFASSFSALIQKIRTLSKPGSENSKPGPLSSNSGVLSLSSSIMASYAQGFRASVAGVFTESDGSLIGRTVTVSGVDYTQLSWAHLGLELSREGSISVNSSRLATALSGKVGEAIAGGFVSELKTVLNSFRGVSGSMQNVLESMRNSVSNLQKDADKAQARIDRMRAMYLAKYSALDAKLVSMRQTSSNVQAALAGLSA
jgi:flagellar hook-associated protein 2